jgi:hypothetical protein
MGASRIRSRTPRRSFRSIYRSARRESIRYFMNFTAGQAAMTRLPIARHENLILAMLMAFDC